MVVYKYNSFGYFIGNHNCQSDPISGGFLFPPSGTYTTIEPTFATNKIPKWSGSIWSLENDNTGIWYSIVDGSQIVIFDFNSSIVGLTRLNKPNEDYTWSGTNWILRPNSEIISNYKEKKFNETNMYVISRLCFVKKIKKFEDITTIFDTKKNQTLTTKLQIDTACNEIITDLF